MPHISRHGMMSSQKMRCGQIDGEAYSTPAERAIDILILLFLFDIMPSFL